SADVSATIGRDHVIDLAVGNRHPNIVHFNFVVIANDATLGRPTIHQIAARTSVVSSELRVEALMPFIVARPVVSLLRRSVHTKKQGSRAAECGQQFPPSDGDCHTPLPCEVRRGKSTTPRACCPNSAAPGAGGACRTPASTDRRPGHPACFQELSALPPKANVGMGQTTDQDDPPVCRRRCSQYRRTLSSSWNR